MPGQREHQSTASKSSPYLGSQIDGTISCRASRNACSLCGALQKPASWLITVLKCLQAHINAIK